MAKQKTSVTAIEKVLIKRVRMSYVSVKEATPIGDSEPHFRVTLLVPKSNKESSTTLRNAVDEAKQKGLKELWDDKLPRKFIDPIQDGDDLADEHPEYEGMWVCKAKAAKERKPKLYNADSTELTQYDGEEIDELFYSGAWASILIGSFAYDNTSVGVGVSLKGAKFVKHDERFGGSNNVSADDFEDDNLD